MVVGRSPTVPDGRSGGRVSSLCQDDSSYEYYYTVLTDMCIAVAHQLVHAANNKTKYSSS